MSTRPRRVASPDRRPALRVVEGEGGRQVRSAIVWMAAVLVVTVFGVAGLQAYLAQEGFRAAVLERQVRQAEEEYALLRARAAELDTPSRLREEAASIGLEPAADPAFLRAPVSRIPDPPDRRGSDYAARRLLHGQP